jgi:3'(2'), 5'-bisphosphate nucleotidase
MGYKVAASNAMETVPALPSYQTLRQTCTDLAREAAGEIMRIYAGDHGVRDKADMTRSPTPTTPPRRSSSRACAGSRPAAGRGRGEMAAGRIGDRHVLAGRSLGGAKVHREERQFTVNIALIETASRRSASCWRGRRHAVARHGGARRRQGGKAAPSPRSPPPRRPMG